MAAVLHRTVTHKSVITLMHSSITNVDPQNTACNWVCAKTGHVQCPHTPTQNLFKGEAQQPSHFLPAFEHMFCASTFLM